MPVDALVFPISEGQCVKTGFSLSIRKEIVVKSTNGLKSTQFPQLILSKKYTSVCIKHSMDVVSDYLY